MAGAKTGKTTGQLPTPGKARRVRMDRAAREEQLIEAAFTQFAEKGLNATRLEDVAKQAGVAKGLVNFYFSSKEELFLTVVHRLVPPLIAELSEVTHSGRSATDILREAITVIYERVVAEPKTHSIFRLLVAEGQRFPELTAFYYNEVVVPAEEVIQKVVRLGTEQGEFDIDIDDQLHRLILGPAIMAIFWQVLFHDQKNIDINRLKDAHLAFILRGLRPVPN